MANRNQILFVVYNTETQQSLAEFLNKDCAVRYCANTFLREAAHEYGKFLVTDWKNLNDEDLFHYARIYLDSMYESHTIKRKVFDEASQGYVKFDETYSVNMRELIDRSELAKIMVKKAKEVISANFTKEN